MSIKCLHFGSSELDLSDHCVKEIHSRFRFSSFDAMSSGDTPMSAGKQLSESFEPAAAADAINAVLRAPSGSASSGLEMQPGVELVDKDVKR